MKPTRDPFALFLGAHDAIRHALAQLEQLAAWPAETPYGDEQRASARDLLGVFEQVIVPHHREEEREFWPLVARADATAEQRESVLGLAQRLQAEHEELERLWTQATRSLHGIAAGQREAVDAQALRRLVEAYRQHAQLEDEVLVPLARCLLSPDAQDRLAIAVLLSRLPAAKWGMV